MFQNIDELPPLIRAALPRRLQEHYRAAYNRAWEKLAAGDPHDERLITARAHEAARLAVESQFEQDEEGRWRRRPVGEDVRREQRLEDETGIG